MRDNSKDRTIERNYIQKWRFLVREYELVKAKCHPQFRFVQDFYAFHDTSRQTFAKYYNRYRLSGSDNGLLPLKRGPKWRSRRTLPFIEEKVLELRRKGVNFVQDFYAFHDTSRQTFAKYYNRYRLSGSDNGLLPLKRGPKWRSRRTLPFIEEKVLELRRKGVNRYEAYAILEQTLKSHTPAPSTIYAIFKRHGLNRLTKPMKQSKRQIIKTRAGELGHLDCHYLSRDLIVGVKGRRYLVCLLDACTRLAWAEMVDDLKSLTVMFSTLKSINLLNVEYGVKFEAILTDNGREVASPTNRSGHPMEKMLMELGIKHRYTRPYRPQTNGKVERFWRTLNEDLLDETTFESVEELKEELVEYLFYYNTQRPHQGLGGKTPLQTLENLSTN